MRVLKNDMFGFLLIVSFLLFSCTKNMSNPVQTVVGKSDQINNNIFVNPFIGTGGVGHAFPGATYPLGLIQLGPDTGNKGPPLHRHNDTEQIFFMDMWRI